MNDIICDNILYDDDTNVEFFYSVPQGKGPFPVIFLLHSYQPSIPGLGAQDLCILKYLEQFVEEGIVAVAISEPGFGNTGGERDCGGPFSQEIVNFVIDYFKAKPFVDKTKMGLYGISQGAILASMVSAQNDDIILQILDGGIYDLEESVMSLPNYLEGFRDYVKDQAEDNLERYYFERSAIYHTDRIKAHTLILHGKLDDRKALPSAEKLDSLLLNSTLVVYPHAAHDIVVDERWNDTLSFVKKHFLNLYDIGKVTFSRAIPASIVLKIDGSIDIVSGKFLEGDAILKVSPLNNENEIDVLDITNEDLSKLLLGPKNTKIRFNVLHSNGLCEDVVIRRK